MSRAVVWGAGAIAILAAAMFVPFDFSSEDVSGHDGTAQPLATREKSASPSRSISAALTESDTAAGQRNAGALPAVMNPRTRSRSADPADTAAGAPPTLSPPTLPYDGSAPLFTGGRLVANATPVATAPAIRAIQSELRRHGCYDGAVDGDWGPASRYAAATFTKAVNAALPVDQPDVALLALARRHPGRACAPEDADLITSADAGAGAAGGAIVGARSPYSASQQPTARAPRIVRSGGAPPIATVMPTPAPGTLPNRMALGIELPPGGAEPAAPVTREPTITRAPDASVSRRNATRP